MKRLIAGWVAGMLTASLLAGGVALATARPDQYDGPTKYLKFDGPDTMPYRIVLTKNCRNAEDTLARLIMVDYTPERVVYRCRYPWTY